MRTIYEKNLAESAPSSITRDTNISAIIKSLDNLLASLAADARKVLLYPRLDELNGEILDLLAWQFHCDFFDAFNYTDEEKRELIRESIAVHRLKGTRYAVEQVVKTFFENAKVKEVGNFRFRINTTGYTGQGRDRAFRSWLKVLYDTKNVRSWLDRIELDLSDDLNNPHLYTGAAQVFTGTIDLPLPKPDVVPVNLHAGAAHSLSGFLFIHLPYPDDVGINLKAGAMQVVNGAITFETDPPPITFLRENPNAELCIGDVGIARGKPFFNPHEILEYEGEVLRMFFGFATDNYRVISLKNPRKDVTAAEIKEVAQYAIDNNLIMSWEYNEYYANHLYEATLNDKLVTTIV